MVDVVRDMYPQGLIALMERLTQHAGDMILRTMGSLGSLECDWADSMLG